MEECGLSISPQEARPSLKRWEPQLPSGSQPLVRAAGSCPTDQPGGEPLSPGPPLAEKVFSSSYLLPTRVRVSVVGSAVDGPSHRGELPPARVSQMLGGCCLPLAGWGAAVRRERPRVSPKEANLLQPQSGGRCQRVRERSDPATRPRLNTARGWRDLGWSGGWDTRGRSRSPQSRAAFGGAAWEAHQTP